jgi:hypothetical protein
MDGTPDRRKRGLSISPWRACSDKATPRRASTAKLCFAQPWQRQVFGVALALSKAGYFDWEDFRLKLIATIGEWEASAR